MGKVQKKPVYPKGITFEQVWAALMENAREIKESRKEFDQQLKKSQKEAEKRTKEFDQQLKESQKEAEKRMKEFDEQKKETDRLLRESQKETDRQIKETDRQMKDYNKRFGDFTNRFGEVVEYMIAPNLQEKFRELGLNFLKANRNTDICDADNQIFLEIDVMLENGDKAILVEIKTKLTTENVKDHIKRIEKMRVYADLHGDKRSFLGAVAGVVMTSNAKKYALEQGFYVIEPSGETLNITPPPGKPKEW